MSNMILFDDGESATRKKVSKSRRRKYLLTLGTVGSVVTILTAVLKWPQVDVRGWLAQPRPLFQLDPGIKGIKIPTEKSLQFKYADSQSTLDYFLSYRNSRNPDAQDIAERCLRKVLHDERANAPTATTAYLLALYGQYNLRSGHRPAGIQQLEEAARLSPANPLIKALLLQAYEEANRGLEAMPTPWPAPIQEQIHGYRLKIDALRQELRPFLALAGPSSFSGCTSFPDPRACGSAAPCKRCTGREGTEVVAGLTTRLDSLAPAVRLDFSRTKEALAYDFVPVLSADTPVRDRFSLGALNLAVAAFDTVGIDGAPSHLTGDDDDARATATLNLGRYSFALHSFIHSSQRVVQDPILRRHRLTFERRLAQVGRLERVIAFDLIDTAPHVDTPRGDYLWSFTSAWTPALWSGESLRAVAHAPVQALPSAEVLPRLGNGALAFWHFDGDGNPDGDCSWMVNGVCADASGDGGHRVLSVGINTYDAVRSGFEPLAYARSDAEKLSQAFGRLGYSATTLVDQRATREQILDALAHEALASRPGDDFVFYFSGHGFSDVNGHGALVTASAGAAPVGVLSLAEVAQILSFHSGTTTVIVDGCLNDLNVMLDVGAASIGYGPNRTRFIAAAGGQALESQRLKAGLYAHAMLDFLNHEVVRAEASRRYRLDFDTLLAVTSAETARLARDLYGLEQRPRRLEPPSTPNWLEMNTRRQAGPR